MQGIDNASSEAPLPITQPEDVIKLNVVVAPTQEQVKTQIAAKNDALSSNIGSCIIQLKIMYLALKAQKPFPFPNTLHMTPSLHMCLHMYCGKRETCRTGSRLCRYLTL